MWEGSLWHVSGFMGYFLTAMFGFATFCDVFWHVSGFSAVLAATFQLFARCFSHPMVLVSVPMVGALLDVSRFLIVLCVVILPVSCFSAVWRKLGLRFSFCSLSLIDC